MPQHYLDFEKPLHDIAQRIRTLEEAGELIIEGRGGGGGDEIVV